MRPNTLAQIADRIMEGESRDKALSEFLDQFYLAVTPEQKAAMLEDEPAPTGNPQLEGLLGAVAEYLAHQHKLPDVPGWAFSPKRYLEHAWHASQFADDGAREYLTFSSPAEFASRNIFTEERPLRRARGPHPSDG
jgi:hypothetical protein